MNKLLFYEGGQPLFLDDIEFFQNTVENMVKGIASAFGDGVISGCKHRNLPAEPPLYYSDKPGYMVRSYESGFVIINGELLYVPAGSVSSEEIGEYWVWKKKEVDDQVTEFENGSTHAIYRRRTAYMTKVNKLDETCIHVTGRTFKDKFDIIKRDRYVMSLEGNTEESVFDMAEVIFTSLSTAGTLVTVNAPKDVFAGTIRTDYKMKAKTIFTYNGDASQELRTLRGGAVTVMNIGEKVVTFKLVATGDGRIHITHDGGAEVLMPGNTSLSFTFMLS